MQRRPHIPVLEAGRTVVTMRRKPFTQREVVALIKLAADPLGWDRGKKTALSTHSTQL